MTNEDLGAIEDFYGPDLPRKSTFQGKIKKWKTKVRDLSAQDNTLLEAMKSADALFFPKYSQDYETHAYYSCGSHGM